MEILIKKGKIVDGTGNPWYFGNLGIDGGKIAYVGSIPVEARKEIDGEGLVVCPGFIDTHSHSDFVFLKDPLSSFKVAQGVTTEVIGNCGFSGAPVPGEKKFVKIFQDYIGQISFQNLPLGEWKSQEDFIFHLNRQGMANNLVVLVGHGNLRIAAMGMDDRAPTKKELTVMKDLLEESLSAGAKGMSTGLMYPPGFYSEVSELIELAHVVAKYGGIFTSHIRNYAANLEESIEELIRVGREASVPIQISHVTAAQEPNWGKLGRVLERVEEARSCGVDITMDRYPYTAANTTFRSVLPPWMQEGGVDVLLERLRDPGIRKKCAAEMGDEYNWNTMYVADCRVHPDLNGKSVGEIAKLWNKDIHETIFDLLLDEKAQPRIIFFIHSEQDMKKALKHPTVMVGSDSGTSGPDSHPRTYGTFPKILRDFVLEQKHLSLEEAVKKMTSFPAQRFGLQDRGIIREGMAADIVMIDLTKVRDRSTYSDPCLPPEGIEDVIINGEIVLEKGSFLRKKRGQVILAKKRSV
jgi:N-acyl-D-amino-acid deacylase